ncbi:MAG TPA: DUF4331 family protein [candidate division Zixibacteria bacterium]|nr:DUF4331 family protein [candidate division Zixibacteria bacterium]
MKTLKMTKKFIFLIFTLSFIVLAGCEDDVVTPPAVEYVQIDRMAIPAINTALIPSNMKDAFNQAIPRNDIADYRPVAEATIVALRNAVNAVQGFPPEDNPGVPAAVLATVLIPDVVTIDFSQPVQFPNGRRLEDDVIDAALGLVLNRGDVLGGGPGVSDAIDSNDKAFLGVFPYLAAEN